MASSSISLSTKRQTSFRGKGSRGSKPFTDEESLSSVTGKVGGRLQRSTTLGPETTGVFVDADGPSLQARQLSRTGSLRVRAAPERPSPPVHLSSGGLATLAKALPSKERLAIVSPTRPLMEIKQRCFIRFSGPVVKGNTTIIIELDSERAPIMSAKFFAMCLETKPNRGYRNANIFKVCSLNICFKFPP